MMLKHYFFLAIFHSFFLFTAEAQRGELGASSIGGKAIDESGEGVPFANVILYQLDSSIAAGASTDDRGFFTLEAKPGKYFLQIQFLSFGTATVSDITKESGKSLRLQPIIMKENAEMLDEVVIQAERSKMEFKLDKRVFNVGQDLGNAGSDAAEILANVPSVDVDIEGNVSLRGSENVRILVNGKQSGLVGSGNADALRLLQGNMIEKIEVITNPSSKYEAEGEVGILNIVLKKEKEKGFNGSFELQTGYPDNHGGSFSINYRRKWVNMFASSGINYRSAPGFGTSYQRYSGPDTSYVFESDRNHKRGGLSSVNRAGADFFINDKNTLTAAVLYKYADADNTATIEYRDKNNVNEVTATTVRDELENEISEDIEASLTHVKTFSKKDRKWTTDIRMSKNYDTELSDLVESYSATNRTPTYQKSSNTEDEVNYLMQTDYEHPIGKKGKFETGARVSLREIQNNYKVELSDDAVTYKTLDAFTDNLLYIENIYAAYALFGNEWKRFSYQFGLRGEYSDIETDLQISGISNPRSYFNLFPSGHFNYKISENNSVQISYSRRLSRPSFRELIPFFSYTDPRRFYGGNPDLNPEYTDSYEAGFLRMFEKGSFLGSVYYRHTTNVVQRITLTDTTGLLRTFPINLGTQDAYGIEMTMSYTINDWWRMNGNVNAYYANIQGAYEGVNYGTTLTTLTSNITSIINLPKDIDFQASLRYRAPRNTPQGKALSVTVLDAGLSKDVLKGNGTLVFSVKDLFQSGRRRSIIDTETLYSESDFLWRARQFQLNFNYRINQKKKRGAAGRPGGDGDDY